MPISYIPADRMRQRAGNISKATELRRIKNDPRWPQPVFLSKQHRCYVEAEADAYLEWLADKRRELQQHESGQYGSVPDPESSAI